MENMENYYLLSKNLKCSILAGNMAWNANLLMDDARYEEERLQQAILKEKDELHKYLLKFKAYGCDKAVKSFMPIKQMDELLLKLKNHTPISRQMDSYKGIDAIADIALQYIYIKDIDKF